MGTVNNDEAREHLLKFLPTGPERLAVEMAGSLAQSKAGGEALVGIEDIGRRHADTEICDLDDHGAVDGAGSVDGDGGLRRGVPQRIVEQFSDEVNDVRGSMTGDDSGRYLPEFDASIFLDA